MAYLAESCREDADLTAAVRVLLAVHEALGALAEHDTRKAELVKLRSGH